MAHKFTAQAEVTLLQLFRVRNKDLMNAKGDAKADPDTKRTNMTMGLHLGYFLAPIVSLGGEFRYQRWLSTPAAVKNDATNASRDTLTYAIGPRFHFKVNPTTWIGPGLS